MKVLLVHNYYGSTAPSGENYVFEAEQALLQAHDHEVHLFTRHSDEVRHQGPWGTLKGAVSTPWNPWMAAAIRRVTDQFQPNVMHVHNTFPLLSPAIFSAVGRRAAKVLTLHNYRLLCPAAIPMRNGKICTQCIDQQSVLPAIGHGCYRGSRLATVPLAMNVALHRALGTWQHDVDAFIALSDFQRQTLISAGLPAHKVFVKPNFYPGKPEPTPWVKRQPYAVFVGRLTEEKGLVTLLQAWAWGAIQGLALPALRIVGEGPLRTRLEAMAADLPVTFYGHLPSAEAQEQIAQAQLLVLPSECFEGFPMVVREAFAFGTPAAVSNLGPLPSIVQAGVNGVLFDPANPESLAKSVSIAWNTPGKLQEMGAGANRAFLQHYTEKSNHQQLMRIYEAAIEIGRQPHNNS